MSQPRRKATYDDLVKVDGHRPRAFQLRATHEGSGEIRAEPFDAVAVELARWWGEA